ncbi:Na(+)/H(+) antiporter subunit C [Actinomadura parmotrematis]|uniref:Na(+)/H(+) antiporter subunit C n=1 Tax=Actinomadura parmotrematis TaxID=2864039 RepID=A0ABS7FKU9_9ACTN|nr:Na(+)/H(+) antiporter subunit C [Actinomadura parmotrematis]MBW8480988.1 Na(+)/H(+) antiporter subunit C [Actinomadura parmotrematis]
MTTSAVLAVSGGVLVACGVAMLLERSLSRLVVGVLVLGNGVNLLILGSGGPAGRAPILDGAGRPVSDPLPQALVLTAIVIALASAAFVLAIGYRSGRLSGDDEVRDDVEDRRLTRGDHELRAEVRAQRRRFRAWRREQRRQVRAARAALRRDIRAERRRRAIDDPARIEEPDPGPGDRQDEAP